MSYGQRWSPEELVLSYYLYIEYGLNKVPWTLMEEVSKLTDRSTNSINLRLANYAYVDPEYEANGLFGGVDIVTPIWNEYSNKKESAKSEALEFLNKLRHVDEFERTEYLSSSRPQPKNSRQKSRFSERRPLIEGENPFQSLINEINSRKDKLVPNAYSSLIPSDGECNSVPEESTDPQIKNLLAKLSCQENQIQRLKQTVAELYMELEELR